MLVVSARLLSYSLPGVRVAFHTGQPRCLGAKRWRNRPQHRTVLHPVLWGPRYLAPAAASSSLGSSNSKSSPLTRGEDETPGNADRATLRQLWLLAREDRRLVGAGLALLTGTTAVSLAVPQLLGGLVDTVLTFEAGSAGGYSPYSVAGALFAMFAAQAAMLTGRSAALSLAGERVAARLRRGVFFAILSQDTAFFDRHSTGDLVNRLASDVLLVQECISWYAAQALRNLFLVVGSGGMLFHLSPWLAAACMAVFPPTLVAGRFFGRRLRRQQRAVQAALASASGVADEAISGLRTVRQLDAERRQHDRYSHKITAAYEHAARMAVTNALYAGTMALGASATLVTVMAVGGKQVVAGVLSPGQLTAFLVYSVYLTDNFGDLTESYAEIMRAMGASERVMQLLRSVPGRSDNLDDALAAAIAASGARAKERAAVATKREAAAAAAAAAAWTATSGGSRFGAATAMSDARFGGAAAGGGVVRTEGVQRRGARAAAVAAAFEAAVRRRTEAAGDGGDTCGGEGGSGGRRDAAGQKDLTAAHAVVAAEAAAAARAAAETAEEDDDSSDEDYDNELAVAANGGGVVDASAFVGKINGVGAGEGDVVNGTGINSASGGSGIAGTRSGRGSGGGSWARPPRIETAAGLLRLSNVKGLVEFDDVRFAYPMRPEADVLRGLTVAVRPGQTLAIVGPSGCGKSTVCRLLTRLYDPQGGAVRLDGVPLGKLDPRWLRREVVGVVEQEPVLFGGSVAENIRYGKSDATDAEVQAAAGVANAHTFISLLPQGYETDVGEGGARLSGGQKQRLAIARAVVRDPPVLLLDEATSALDSESERLVQAALERVTLDRTSIIIAHRLSTVRRMADVIAVLRDGRVVEAGSYAELMAKPCGEFRAMVAYQTGE